jgi:hypothetical protein
MPQIFRVGSYLVYFWSDESSPIEPIHVHVTEGKPTSNGTKIWITQTGRCLVSHNKSKIPERILKNIMRVIEARSGDIVKRWLEQFGEISYYC